MLQVKDFLKKQKQQTLSHSDTAIELHHLLMKEYGWISPKEFGETPIPAILHLVDRIIRDKKEEKKQNDKAMNKGNVRKPRRR